MPRSAKINHYDCVYGVRHWGESQQSRNESLKYGAHDQNRTDDPHLTMVVLYRLSYAGPEKHMERETGFEPATLSLEG